MVQKNYLQKQQIKKTTTIDFKKQNNLSSDHANRNI